MIRVYRRSEPACLSPVRARELARLRQLEPLGPIQGSVIDGYRVVAKHLWRRQYEKCCYCERKVLALFNDVEHFRPKGRAIRSPGCAEEHGYYWLAFTWQNLLFACDVCNRTGKNDLFPLQTGSKPLQPWQDPPGDEKPLLLDPAVEHGVSHIEFHPWSSSPRPPHERTWRDVTRWHARPRAGSDRGRYSIDAFGLNHDQLQELYQSHVRDAVTPCVDAIREAILDADPPRVRKEVDRAQRQLFTRSVPHVGLSYDAMCFFVPSHRLAPFQVAWPSPSRVGLPPPPRRIRGGAPP